MFDRRALLSAFGAAALAPAGQLFAAQVDQVALRGFNLVETDEVPFGSAAARQSIETLAGTGATAAAVIPFLWQETADAGDIEMGNALPPERIVAGVEQLHAAGLAAIVKPHVWVPESWAGAIEPEATSRSRWYAAYGEILQDVAKTAEQAKAEVLVIGTELRGVSGASEWKAIIAKVRNIFSGRITYVAHGADEAEEVAFWPELDAVAVSLYPVLGADDAFGDWDRAMAEQLDRVEAVARSFGKPVWIAEIGIRSAQGAALKPWESAEERVSPPDMALQAQVLKHWLSALEARGIRDVWIWRWFSDPEGGGPEDTDFTVQNKTAQTVITQCWDKIPA